MKQEEKDKIANELTEKFGEKNQGWFGGYVPGFDIFVAFKTPSLKAFKEVNTVTQDYALAGMNGKKSKQSLFDANRFLLLDSFVTDVSGVCSVDQLNDLLKSKPALVDKFAENVKNLADMELDFLK